MTDRKFAYPFKGLRAEFPQFLGRARRDIVAGIARKRGWRSAGVVRDDRKERWTEFVRLTRC